MLSEVDYVICLDSVGRGNSLNFHVSKPPKEGTAAFTIIEVGRVIKAANVNVEGFMQG